MSRIQSETFSPAPGVRLLGHRRAVCAECRREVHQVNGPRVRPGVHLLVTGVHGPRDERCAGSHQAPLPWIEACGLPAWADLSDHDKGQALDFAWMCHWERDYHYARENYPPTFRHPVLAELAAWAGEPGGGGPPPLGQGRGQADRLASDVRGATGP